MFNKIKQGERIGNYEFEIKCKTGETAMIYWNHNLLHGQSGEIKGIIFIGLDISERRELEERLHYLAYYDYLTHLPNRILLEDIGTDLIKRAQEGKQKLAFIYLDVDNFKNINDTLGHGSGDGLLVFVANILSEQIVSPNVIARLGGDEFAIILTDINSIDDITEVIKGILSSLRRPYNIRNREFYISVSIGVAIYPEHGENLATLMQNADTAMFHIKNLVRTIFPSFLPICRKKPGGIWK